MTSSTMVTSRPAFSLKLLAGGFVAGMVMGMWTMILEAVLPNGNGFWSPLVYIAATVMRNLQGVSAPVAFDAGPVVVGLMGHMMNSIILGLIFALLIAPRIPSLTGQIGAGIVYSIIIFAVMWFLVVPAVDPVLLHLNGFVFFLGHVMWGLALGAVNYWVTHTA